MKKNNLVLKKRLYAIIAFITVAGLLLTGTYAFVDFSQHKSNDFGNAEANYHDVMLIEDFDPNDGVNWSTTDDPVKKEIRVKNTGLSTASDDGTGYGDLFVRISLKEYFEKQDITYSYYTYEGSTIRFAVNAAGEFVTFENYADMAGTPYEGCTPIYLTNAITGKSAYYVVTNDKLINGQYGKYLVTDIEKSDTESLVPTVTKSLERTVAEHHNAANGECEYTPRVFASGDYNDDDNGFSEYVKWYLNNSKVITYSEWIDPTGDYDGALGQYWIYDEMTGWAYWGAPLSPGETTANLIEFVELVKQPSGEFYYCLHADLEALSADELAGTNAKWTDAPIDLISNFTGKTTGTGFDNP